MSYIGSDDWAQDITADNDRKNLETINQAVADGRIDNAAGDYLKMLYSDSMHWFREVFYVLGKCFGAPKAAVMKYDYNTNSAIDAPIRIADINPLSPYVVNHRLDADPMRNQFFTSAVGQRVDLAVSSIVTVIVGARAKVLENKIPTLLNGSANLAIEHAAKELLKGEVVGVQSK